MVFLLVDASFTWVTLICVLAMEMYSRYSSTIEKPVYYLRIRGIMHKCRRVPINEILADPVLRRKLMVGAIRAIQHREGIDTTVEQAQRAYDKVREERALVYLRGLTTRQRADLWAWTDELPEPEQS